MATSLLYCAHHSMPVDPYESTPSDASASQTVTRWIEQLRVGDAAASEKLWARYFEQMVELARRRLDGARRTAADEEDVALSAFKSFCLGVQRGRFPKLTDRNSLWSLLVAITAHKCVDLIRHENRWKRGGRPAAGGEAIQSSQAPSFAAPISQIICEQPTPEFAAAVAEQFDLLVAALEQAEDADLKEIAVAKMRGDTTVKIADRLGCARRTVERKVQFIRRIWESQCQ